MRRVNRIGTPSRGCGRTPMSARGAGRLLRAVLAVAGLGVAVLAGVPAALGQRVDPMRIPTSPAVERLLEQAFLKDAERRELRLRHGRAVAEDLDTVSRRARYALIVGAYDDPSLADADAPGWVRIEGLLQRGEARGALAMLEDDRGEPSPVALRQKAQALEMLGRYGEAERAGLEAVALLQARRDALRAEDLVECVRAAAVHLRHKRRGGDARDADPQVPPDDRAGDFQALMALLAEARRRDPLLWSVAVAEGELLLDKDNFAQAQEAVREALMLNPSSAEAWRLMGTMAVAALDIGGAERIAARLDALSVMPGGPEGGNEGVSPLGAVIRARAMLRQNDPDLAEEALRPALERSPQRPDLRAWRAAVEAVRYDFAATERLLEAFDQEARRGARAGEPVGAPSEALLAVGRALSDARQYEFGAEVLRRAAERSPGSAQAWTELGLLEMQAGRDDLAEQALQRATALDPFNVRAENSLRLLRDLATFERHESEHFVVRSRPGLDARLAQEMLPVLERMHAVVCGDGPGGLRHVPAQRTIIDLMPDHARFAVRIAGLPRIHTIAASTGPIIAMETPREGPGHTGTYDWERVVRHEYTHTVGLSRTGNRIPHWFTEAQAVLLELAPRDYSTVQLLTRAVERDDLFDLVRINLAFARPERPTDRAQAYAQGHWMLQFIHERFGPDAPIRLMDLYARGIREEQAFREVLGLDRAGFLEAFTAFARRELVAWGMWPPEGQPRLADLRGDGVEQRREPTPEQVRMWLEQYPDHPEVLELAVRSALAETQGAPTEALRPLLERYARARPVDPMPHRHLARLALAADDPERAVPHLEYLDAREEKSPTYAAQLATIAARLGRLDEARDKAERATRLAPYSAANRELAAAVAVQRRDYPAARRHIEFLIELEPDRAIHRQRLEALERRAQSDGHTGGQ